MLLLGGVSGALGYIGYALTRNVWALDGMQRRVHRPVSVTFAQLFALARDTFGRSAAAAPVHEPGAPVSAVTTIVSAAIVHASRDGVAPSSALAD
jgi:hypothetical protein